MLTGAALAAGENRVLAGIFRADAKALLYYEFRGREPLLWKPLARRCAAKD